MGNILGNVGAAKNGAGLVSLIPSLVQLFSGTKSNSGSIASQSQGIANAMTNTQNPLYQQLYGQFNQQNKTNAASAISAADAQNRLNAAMGRVPLFSPERRGQESFRNSILASQNAGQTANQQTLATLQAANRGLSGALDAGNEAYKARFNNQVGNVLGYSNLANFLGAL